MNSWLGWRGRVCLLSGLWGVWAPACSKSSKESSSGAATAPEELATVLFAQRCSSCHGARGRGDGPAATALNPRPRDLSDPAWQAAVTDQHIRKIIVSGGGSVGMSPAMPPSLDLSDDELRLDALVEHVRSLAR